MVRFMQRNTCTFSSTARQNELHILAIQRQMASATRSWICIVRGLFWLLSPCIDYSEWTRDKARGLSYRATSHPGQYCLGLAVFASELGAMAVLFICSRQRDLQVEGWS